MLDVLGRGAAQDALGKRGDDRAAVDFGLDVDALLGAAIFGGDDAVVGHVDETAGEIARVRRLERGVGQTLAGAVGELKYSRTVRPSLKFDRIGVSMIEPSGRAIRPRMPASCFICCGEPRAPEWLIM